MTTASSSPMIRLATPDDVSAIFYLIQGLAEYEKLAHEVVGNEALLYEHLFGDRPYIESFIVEDSGTPVGFALFFQNYSTTISTSGYYLEDLFVRPEYRGQGFGKALLSALVQKATNKQFHHLQWSVLDWNTPAIAFYQRIGATISETDRIARITGDALTASIRTDESSFSVRLVTVDDLSESTPSGDPDADLHPSILSHLTNVQYSALKAAVASQPPDVEALMVCRDSKPVGFATFTHSYSTFLTQPGIVVEAMLVLSEHGSLDIQAAVLNTLARLANERQCGRLEWFVQHDDVEAIAQCERLGGMVKTDWRICRMDTAAILRFAN